MVPLPTSHLRAVRGTPDQRRRWARAIETSTLANLTVLKRSDTVSVYAATLDGQAVILKCWALRSLAHRAYAHLRTTRGSRQWRGTRRLRDIGVPAPACLTLLHGRSPAGPVEVLVMQRLDGRTLLDHLASPTLPVRAQHRLAEDLARACASMAQAGWFTRDPKPSNFMVVPANEPGAANSQCTVAVLDSVAIRPLPPHRRHALGVPLERLVLEAIGVSCPPRRTLIARFIAAWAAAWPQESPAADARRTRRRVWHEIQRRVAAADDPTPADNPLAPVA